MKMAYILISLGIVLVIAGAISLYQTKTKPDSTNQPEITTHTISPTTQPSIVQTTQKIDSNAPQTTPNPSAKTNTTQTSNPSTTNPTSTSTTTAKPKL